MCLPCAILANFHAWGKSRLHAPDVWGTEPCVVSLFGRDTTCPGISNSAAYGSDFLEAPKPPSPGLAGAGVGVTWAPIMPRKVLGHSTIAGQLMDLGVDPTALDDRLCSALHYAAGRSIAARLKFGLLGASGWRMLAVQHALYWMQQDCFLTESGTGEGLWMVIETLRPANPGGLTSTIDVASGYRKHYMSVYCIVSCTIW